MENNMMMKPCAQNDSCASVCKCYAYAYVVPQSFSNLYSINEALCNGTLFKDLNLPLGVYEK